MIELFYENGTFVWLNRHGDSFSIALQLLHELFIGQRIRHLSHSTPDPRMRMRCGESALSAPAHLLQFAGSYDHMKENE